MIPTATSRRKALLTLGSALGAALAASACAPVAAVPDAGPRAPDLLPGAPVPVALLVPAGGSDADAVVARDIENAARLAVADLQGVAVDLRIYPTAGSEAQAAAAAQQAVADGAAIILGPLRAEEAVAAGNATAGSGVNVLSFSTNQTVAGGNVFVLGPTFLNTATRLLSYGRGQGIDRVLVAYGNDLGGTIGRDSAQIAAERAGVAVTGTEVYALSQQGIADAAPRVAAAAAGGGAQAVVTTANPNADLPALAQALPAAGLPAGTRLIGLTRWDAAPSVLSLPALQGGLFAIPDQGFLDAFEARYAGAYGGTPLPPAALAYDGIAAIGALVARGDAQALSRGSLTAAQGFQGTAGIFRLRPDGTNERGLAVATVQDGQVVILDPAPRSFGIAGA